MNLRTVSLIAGLAALSLPSWAYGQYVVPAAPVVVHRPLVPVAPAPVAVYRPVVVAPGVAPVIIRPKVYVPGQPIRNVLCAITP